MDVRVGLQRKLGAQELMLLNCGAGEDSWESLGLQQDQTSPLKRKPVLKIHWKDWCWSWNSNTLATWCMELSHWKRPWFWERLKAGGEGDEEDEMVGWHHQLEGYEFEQVTWVGYEQESLACCILGISKSSTWLSDWTEFICIYVCAYIHSLQPPLSMGFPRQEYWSGLPLSRVSSQPRDQTHMQLWKGWKM